MIGVCLCESWRLCLCVSSQRKEECILSVGGSDPDIRFATFLWLYFLFLVSTSSFVGDTCAYTRPSTRPREHTHTHIHAEVCIIPIIVVVRREDVIRQLPVRHRSSCFAAFTLAVPGEWLRLLCFSFFSCSRCGRECSECVRSNSDPGPGTGVTHLHDVRQQSAATRNQTLAL